MAEDLVGVDFLRAEGFGVSWAQASVGMLCLFGSVCTRCRFWGGGGGQVSSFSCWGFGAGRVDAFQRGFCRVSEGGVTTLFSFPALGGHRAANSRLHEPEGLLV